MVTEQDTKRQKKAEKFKRLASQRTNAVLEKLRILGNCGNRDIYEYTDEDVKRIFRTIETEVRRAKANFQSGKKSQFEL